MTIYGLAHTGHINPVCLRKVTELRGEALLHNGNASLIIFPTLQTYSEDKLLPNLKLRQRIGESKDAGPSRARTYPLVERSMQATSKIRINIQ